MADVFWSMIKSASLRNSQIYEIKETLTEQHKLQYANYAKRVEILPPSVPLRVPKGQGPNQHPPSQCPLSFQWCNPLPVVWERGAE